MGEKPASSSGAEIIVVNAGDAALPTRSRNGEAETVDERLLRTIGEIVPADLPPISKLGLDIGFTKRGVIVWGVFAPTSGYKRHALAGHYGGASAQASLVAGLGANVLVGGSGRSFALQPFSVSGQTGVNLAVGIAGLDLYAAR